MIRKYNRIELFSGVGCLIAGIIGYACAWFFFRHVPRLVMSNWGIWIAPLWLTVSTIAALLVVTVSGYRMWRRTGGFQSYAESGFYHEFDLSSSSGALTDFYAHRVTGPAYILSQLFLAGPLMFLRGITHFRNRIPTDDGLEASLCETLAKLQQLGKWQSLADHPGAEREILMLAKMRQIDFSTARGPRFRAYPADHTFSTSSDR
jgi:hypothetical protein